MNVQSMHWVKRGAALGLALGLTAGFAAAAVAQSLSGQAYGAYVNTALGSVSQSPIAVLPYISGTDGDMASAQADGLSVGGALSSDFLNSTTSGAIGAAETGAQSVATVADISILGGLIIAKEVIANATSSSTADGAASNGNASSFEDLVVNGVSVTVGDAALAPNTRMDLPGVGYVVLNEQIPTGDGVTSSGLTVNMIHVVEQSPILGLLGQVIGYQTVGEIIVGSASSSVGP